MEFKFMNNPQIMTFLNQYSKKEWDSIIEDLLLYSINKVNEIEKEQDQKKEIKSPPKKIINKSSEIISFKNCKYTPYECAKNMIIQNAEYRCNKGINNKTMKKLNGLDKKINDIKIKK
jgi:hypothetical protein